MNAYDINSSELVCTLELTAVEAILVLSLVDYFGGSRLETVRRAMIDAGVPVDRATVLRAADYAYDLAHNLER